MKRVFTSIFILYIIGNMGLVAAGYYSWTGQLEVGQGVYINDMYIVIDRDRLDNRTAAVIHYNGDVRLLFSGEVAEIEGLRIRTEEFNNYMLLKLSSESAFTVQFENVTAEDLEDLKDLQAQVANLTAENEDLKQQLQQLKTENEKLKQQLQIKVDPAKLQAQITNLTKENRDLKAQLNNQTEKINKLLAENNFLKQQIEEYRSFLTKVMETESSKNKKSYIEQAEKKEKIGTALISTLVIGGAITGVVLYGAVKAERKYKRHV